MLIKNFIIIITIIIIIIIIITIRSFKKWKCKRSVIPIVIGTLGAVSKHLEMWVSTIGTPGIITLLQKAYLLGTAKILRRTLDT